MKVLLLAAAFLLVHDDYPPLCCNGTEDGGDCHPVPCDQITETKRGYEWHGFSFSTDQTHISFDKQCHACVGRNYWQGKPVGDPIHPRCLFILPSA